MIPATLLWLASVQIPAAPADAAPPGPSLRAAPAEILIEASAPVAPLRATVLQATPAAPPAAPDYPIDDLGVPCTRPACGAFVLVDAGYTVSRAGGTDQLGLARFRIGDRAFFGVEGGDRRRSLFVTTARLDLGWTHRPGGRHEIAGEWRAPVVRFGGALSRRAEGEGGGWGGELRGAVRLGDDFEVLARAAAFEDPEPTEATPFVPAAELRGAALGFLWQQGTGLDLLVEASARRIRAPSGLELDRQRLAGSTVWYASGLELQAEVAWERDLGRLAREEVQGRLGVDVQIGGHLVAHAETFNRFEPDLKKVERDVRAGLTFFGRRHRFERGGEAAERTVELARRARRLGYNERRVHSIAGRRGLRERLSVSARADELAADIEALYRAQVAERNVPQLGFELARGTDDIQDITARRFEIFAALPWPLAWPWAVSEDSVRFLSLRYDYVESDINPLLSTIERRLRLDLELNREAAIFLAWTEPAPTPIQIATRSAPPSRIELGLEWAMGR